MRLSGKTQLEIKSRPRQYIILVFCVIHRVGYLSYTISTQQCKVVDYNGRTVSFEKCNRLATLNCRYKNKRMENKVNSCKARNFGDRHFHRSSSDCDPRCIFRFVFLSCTNREEALRLPFWQQYSISIRTDVSIHTWNFTLTGKENYSWPFIVEASDCADFPIRNFRIIHHAKVSNNSSHTNGPTYHYQVYCTQSTAFSFAIIVPFVWCVFFLWTNFFIARGRQNGIIENSVGWMENVARWR